MTGDGDTDTITRSFGRERVNSDVNASIPEEHSMDRTVLVAAALCGLSIGGGSGCRHLAPRQGKDPAVVNKVSQPGPDASFEEISRFVASAADAVVLAGDGNARALVSPRLQGRLLTVKVGAVESTGFVNLGSIARGDTDLQFNNHGGADRFWIYPEAGQFGLYFDPGSELDRKVWKVPADLNAGGWSVTASGPGQVGMKRDLALRNYTGTEFKVRAEREVAMVPSGELPSELGFKLPPGVAFAGVSTRNQLTNTGTAAWTPEKGLIGIWILGMFQPSDSAAIIAPFRPGSDRDLGPPFNDEYFGKVSADAPERIKVLKNVVVLKADARRVGKLGVSQQRTTGLGGSIDFKRGLLTIVKFDVPQVPERYGNSTWVKNQPEPFRGDAFQTYNHGPPDLKSNQVAEAPFYELESTSPVRPLAPGETITHRHVTYHFQGDLDALEAIARQTLAVELTSVREALKL